MSSPSVVVGNNKRGVGLNGGSEHDRVRRAQPVARANLGRAQEHGARYRRELQMRKMQQHQLDLVGYILCPLLKRCHQQFKQHQFRSHCRDAPLSDGFQHAIGGLTVGGRSLEVIDPDRSVERDQPMAGECRN